MEREWLLDRSLHARHLRKLVDSRRVDCIIDVGANHGQFHDFVREQVGWAGPVVSVEPIPELAADLRRRAAADTTWSVHEAAIGAEEGRMMLNVAASDGFSSLRDADSDTATLVEDKSRVVRRVEVRIRTLRSLLQEAAPTAQNILLKSDTQGWDLEVLRGLGAAAAHVVAVQIELPITKLYKGMPDLGEGIARLREMGFEVTGFFPVDSQLPDMRILEVDCVAARPLAETGTA